MWNISRTARGRGVFVAVVAAGLLALSACGGGSAEGEAGVAEGSWDDIVAAANEEGGVFFTNGGSQEPADRLIEAFNKEYPDIKVDTERITAEGIARIETEIKTGTKGTDVFMLADAEWFKDFEGEFLVPEGPNAEGIDDAKWATDDAAVMSGVPYSLFVWNTDKFPDGFDDWQDILDPSVKDQLAMRNTASTTAAAFLDFLTENFGEEYLQGLSDQQPKLYPSVVPMTTAVGAGEVGVTIASAPAEAMTLKESGAPIDYAYTSPALGIDYVAAALKNARNPNAALVFYDFMLSPEGQEALNGDGFGVASRRVA